MVARYGAGSRWLNERHPGVAPRWPLSPWRARQRSGVDAARHAAAGVATRPPSGSSTALGLVAHNVGYRRSNEVGSGASRSASSTSSTCRAPTSRATSRSTPTSSAARSGSRSRRSGPGWPRSGCAEGPRLLLAEHLGPDEQPLLVHRVDDLEAKVAELEGRGLEVEARFGIPHGPGAALRTPGGQRHRPLRADPARRRRAPRRPPRLLAQERPATSGCRAALGLVLGDEGAAVVSTSSKRPPRKQLGEPPPVVAGEDLVAARPRARAPACRSSAGSRPPRTCSGCRPRAAGARGRAARRGSCGSGRCSERMIAGSIGRAGHPAVGGRQPLHELEPHRPGDESHQRSATRPASSQVALRGRRELLERVAGGQHEPADPLRVVADQPLGDRAAGVVGDDRDVVELERVEQVGDDPRAGRGARGRCPRAADASARRAAGRARCSGTRRRGPGATLRHRSPLTPTPWTKTIGRPSAASRGRRSSPRGPRPSVVPPTPSLIDIGRAEFYRASAATASRTFAAVSAACSSRSYLVRGQKKPRRPSFLHPRDDVGVQVGHRLADDVVDRHERALRAHRVADRAARAGGRCGSRARPARRAGRRASRGARAGSAASGRGRPGGCRGRRARPRPRRRSRPAARRRRSRRRGSRGRLRQRPSARPGRSPARARRGRRCSRRRPGPGTAAGRPRRRSRPSSPGPR